MLKPPHAQILHQKAKIHFTKQPLSLSPSSIVPTIPFFPPYAPARFSQVVLAASHIINRPPSPFPLQRLSVAGRHRTSHTSHSSCTKTSVKRSEPGVPINHLGLSRFGGDNGTVSPRPHAAPSQSEAARDEGFFFAFFLKKSSRENDSTYFSEVGLARKRIFTNTSV